MTPENARRHFLQARRCIASAADTVKTRATTTSIDALEDIECDLEAALKAVKLLISTAIITNNTATE